MLKIDSIKTPEISDEGVWVKIPEWEGVEFLVRRLGSRDYQIARELLVQKKSKALQRLPTTPEMEPELGKLVSRHLLRGWKGIADGNGKEITWSPDVGLEMLTDPTLRELESKVIWAAGTLDDTSAEFTADAVKNSAAPSASS